MLQGMGGAGIGVRVVAASMLGTLASPAFATAPAASSA